MTCEGAEDSNTAREYLEQALLANKIKVLVATTALGMGFDKPDLGFVIHYQMPGVYCRLLPTGGACRACYRFRSWHIALWW